MATSTSDKERAKQRIADAKAKAKADRKAAKERKRNSTDPKDMGTLRQIYQAYKLTKEQDPAVTWLLLAAFLLPIVIGVVVGILINQWIWLLIMGIMVGLILAMLVLLWRVKAATYKRYEGMAGSSEVALQMLDKKKWSHTPAIAATRHQDVVHRAVGRGGIVLVGEGDQNRVRQMLNSEVKKHEKFADGVIITTFVVGDKEGQVPLNKLAGQINKLPKMLEKYQVSEVNQRLKAIDAMRPVAPIPKGPVPTSMKGARRQMRGR
ncbi:DUF4191 domain-containing protein [Granulicoccus phenolivorans]|uniref:DUF4191 domain-containing protein n=1 Tax=Granulicoccus phenolivorans TaxID=266854 RepID=UPI0004259132|nr:DUF4191 domain-containing protein [Granulicoccus phenolivorans]